MRDPSHRETACNFKRRTILTIIFHNFENAIVAKRVQNVVIYSKWKFREDFSLFASQLLNLITKIFLLLANNYFNQNYLTQCTFQNSSKITHIVTIFRVIINHTLNFINRETATKTNWIHSPWKYYQKIIKPIRRIVEITKKVLSILFSLEKILSIGREQTNACARVNDSYKYKKKTKHANFVDIRDCSEPIKNAARIHVFSDFPQ